MAKKRKRLKWGRWLLLALVVLYFAPVIPAPWQLWDCGPDWQDGLNVEGGGEEGCEPREGREWVSPSSAVASLFMHQLVYTAHIDGQSYEGYTEEAAERRTGQARFGLTLARISTFRPQSLNRRIQRERAFLMQHDGEYERASRRFEWLTQYSRYALPGDVYVRIDFFYARRNAFLAGDMDRVWTLTESGLDGMHPTEFYQRAGWLLNSADIAIYADAFDRADDYINRAAVWAEQIEAGDEGAWMRSAVLNARADQSLARFDATGDPALAEAALADYESADADFGSPFFGENHIRALSHLARCEEASAAIDARLAALDTEEVYSFCQEPENGITLDVWRLQVSRCRLMRIGNRDGADEACAEVEAMAARGCADSSWEPDRDLMRLPESYPQPLACFAEN